MIFVIKLSLHEGKRSPVVICLWFSLVKSLKIITISEICPVDQLKSKRKKQGLQRQFSPLFAILCFLPLSQIWSYEFFIYQQALGRAQMFNSPANLRKFQRRKRDNSFSKDPYFLCRKTLRHGRELRQDLYLSMRKLYKTVAFSFPWYFLFGWHLFRRRMPMNITGAVDGNPRFHYIKTV